MAARSVFGSFAAASASSRSRALTSPPRFMSRRLRPQCGFMFPRARDPSGAPIITAVTDNGTCVGCIERGATYTVRGTQLNGLSLTGREALAMTPESCAEHAVRQVPGIQQQWDVTA